jgi:primosomal protein N' (replication factor Y) (superfamily II helicase)
MNIAKVLVFRGMTIFFSYIIPESEKEIYQPGCHVIVPFGRSKVEGLIVSVNDDNSIDIEKLKEIESLDPKKPTLEKELLNLILWFKAFYHTTPFKAYQTIIGKKKMRDLSKLVYEEEPEFVSDIKLTEDQEIAIKTIKEHKSCFQQFLLFGVTASGKTEVYIRVAKHMISKGKKSLILVPEIALTPQYTRIFTERFGNKVAVLHSGLTPKEREIAWSRVIADQVDIVIGPRSAIFAPLKNLGLVIIDEEHEGSYKQENHPRYLTHTIAKFRAQENNCFLIYGSATPGIETYNRCFSSEPDEKAEIIELNLKHRVLNQVLPRVEIIDMKDDYLKKAPSPISIKLQNAILANIENKEKTMILINRRGFATQIICQKCATVHTCPQCNLSYTYHQDRTFRCHRCGTSKPVTNLCHKCKANSLSFVGMGIQKIETELIKLFPQAKILRLDRDSAKTHNQTEKILTEFRADGDILVGTQLIAKGHHIDEVTLVGVLGIDRVLNIPDFRSPERVFQLLTQVAGRAGRGTKPGRVYIQTYQAEHHAIEHAITHNFEEFYKEEIEYRKELWYPPFSCLINIILSSKSEMSLVKFGTDFHKIIYDKLSLYEDKIMITDPGPAPFEKMQNYYRWNILIKCTPEIYSQVKNDLDFDFQSPNHVRVIVDFEPKSIL